MITNIPIIENACLSTFIFNDYLQHHQHLLSYSHWTINDRILLFLLNKNGYLISDIKYSPIFLKRLYTHQVSYFAYKCTNDNKYHIVLKSFSKTHPFLKFKNMK